MCETEDILNWGHKKWGTNSQKIRRSEGRKEGALKGSASKGDIDEEGSVSEQTGAIREVTGSRKLRK